MAFDRIQKVNSLLFSEINNLLLKEGSLVLRESEEKEVLISITKVETNRDLKSARVFFIVIPEKYRSKAKTFLEHKSIFLQKSLGEKIILKYIPKLSFIYDEGQSNAFMVEKILSGLKKEK